MSGLCLVIYKLDLPTIVLADKHDKGQLQFFLHDRLPLLGALKPTWSSLQRQDTCPVLDINVR